MFFISAIFKSQSASWRSGIAVYQALQLDMYTHDFSFLFRDLPTGLYQFLTYTTLLVEFAAPVLLLLGGFSDKARLLAWATLSLFAIVFTLLLRLGIFPLVVFCALVPLFPTLGFTMLGSKQKETIAVKQNFRGLLNIFAGVVICVVIYGNLHKTFSKTFPISQQVKKYIYLPTLLQQNWNVYGQEKWRSTSVSLIASTTKGTKGNLWEWWSAGISEDKIRMFPASMHYYRNSFHLIGLNDFLYFHGNREYENNRLGRLSNYLCRKYNSSHQNNKIENVQVWSSKREVLNFHEIYFNTPSLIRSVDCE